MQFRQVGRRIQVLAPAWDAKAKRTRQRMAMSFPADEMPMRAHAGQIREIDGLDRDAAAMEISEWIAARRKERLDERLKTATIITASSIDSFRSFDQPHPIDNQGWSMSVNLYKEETFVSIRKSKLCGYNTLSAHIIIEKIEDGATVVVKDNTDTKFSNFNMEFFEAIRECNALIEAFEG